MWGASRCFETKGPGRRALNRLAAVVRKAKLGAREVGAGGDRVSLVTLIKQTMYSFVHAGRKPASPAEAEQELIHGLHVYEWCQVEGGLVTSMI